ncbi:MAG: AraC family transcriptional regulator [Clostridiales bacterium]|nr:AraC family transcriptional regulator [Clostridiales bacterium]
MGKQENCFENLNLNILFGNLNIKVLNLVKVSPNRDWYVPDHSHADFEFHIIPGGRGYIGIQGHDLAVNGGEFYITGPYMQHRQLSDKENPMAEYCLECEINVLDSISDALTSSKQEIRLLKDILAIPYPVIFKDTEGISAIFEELFREAEEQAAGFYLKLQTLVVNILIGMFRSVISAENIKYKSVLPQKSVDDFRINRLVKFVETNYKRVISLEDISKVLFLSPRQINRLMKKEFNWTFHDYLLQYRLSAARQLLEDSNLSIEEIAYESGFSSYFYMYQVFRHAGMQPPAKLRAGKET